MVEGTQSQPTARGSFVVDNVSYRKYSADHLQGQFTADRRAIDLLNVDLVRQSSQIKVRGQVFLDPSNLTPTGDVHLLAAMRDVTIEDLLAAAGQSYPLSGNVSGDFMATGKYPTIELQGVANVRNGKSSGSTLRARPISDSLQGACAGGAKLGCADWHWQS